MKKLQLDTIVWDLDNTPWDWVAYASRTYPAMRDLLVRRTGESREKITACMRNFYQRAGAIESSWLVQDLERQGLLKATETERDRLISSVRSTFHACRQKYLHFFDGFPEIFEMAARNGFSNLIHTDAPATHAASRIKHLKLDQTLFKGMIAMPDSLPAEVPGRFLKQSERENFGLRFPVYLADKEKPDTDLAGLLGLSDEEIRQRFAFAGDNYGKDMAEADRFGALGFHALWGRSPKSDLDIVGNFSGPRIANRNSSQFTDQTPFMTVISVGHPLDIAQFLGWE